MTVVTARNEPGCAPGGTGFRLQLSSATVPRACAVAVLICFCLAGAASAGDALVRVSFHDSAEETRSVGGRILVEAADGGILLEGRDGRLWNVTPKQLQKREPTGKEFQPLSAEELGRQLQSELGEDFEVHTTGHYVICSNAGKVYAKWCGILFERLLRAFVRHWRAEPLQTAEPARPLPAIVFADRREYAAYAVKDAGPEMADSIGYYSIRTNRMVLYDLTSEFGGRPARTMNDITRKLAALPFNAATIVHEATHQIAFNCGLHTRYADNPLWLTEGMAMYFETPDLRSRTGWRTVGRINPRRHRQFAEYARSRRRPGAIESLIADDKRFTEKSGTADAYAEAWALTYFLIKTKRKLYIDYLHRISQKPRLVWDTPAERLAAFKAAFDEDLARLDREFLEYMQRLGRR